MRGRSLDTARAGREPDVDELSDRDRATGAVTHCDRAAADRHADVHGRVHRHAEPDGGDIGHACVDGFADALADGEHRAGELRRSGGTRARAALRARPRAVPLRDLRPGASVSFRIPSFAFLRTDPSTRTGLRVEYAREAMPANTAGVHIDPTEWNRLDGFSPSTPIVVLFPQGVDLAASGAASIDDVARSLEPDSPTVIYDTQTGRRVPHFVELDANASGPATQALILRPAVRLRDQGLYAVAIRGLVDPAGDAIVPPRAFRILRDGLATPVQAIERRRARFEGIVAALEEEGVERENLILAWDFVTASATSLTGRALAVRDQGLAANGAGRAAVRDHLRRARGERADPAPRARPLRSAALSRRRDAAGIPQPRRCRECRGRTARRSRPSP